MPELVLKSTGQRLYVPPDGLADALASGLYQAPAADAPITVEVRPGLVGETTVGALGSVPGATPEREATFRARERGYRVEREHGGVVGTATALVENALNEATFGGVGALGGLIGGDDYTERRLERAEANPIAAGIGKATGIIAPAVLSGGTGAVAKIAAATPVGATARLGSRIARTAEDAGSLTKLGRAVVGGAVEGGLSGLGEGISDVALSKDPRIGDVLSSKMLFGGAVGGAAGGIAKAAEIGLVRARGALDRYAASKTFGQEVPDDIAKLDTVGLKKAEEAELQAIEAARAPERKSLFDEIAKFRSQAQRDKPWEALTQNQTDTQLKTIGRQSWNADKSLDKLLDNPKSLASDPKKAADVMESLQRQEHALEGLEELHRGVPLAADDVAEGMASEVRARGFLLRSIDGPKAEPLLVGENVASLRPKRPISAGITPNGRVVIEDASDMRRLAVAQHNDQPINVMWRSVSDDESLALRTKLHRESVAGEIKAGKIPDELGPFSPQGLELAVDRYMKKNPIEVAVESRRAAGMRTAVSMLERNRALQARIAELTAAPTSSRLRAIGVAKEALEQGSPGVAQFASLAGIASPMAGAAASVLGRMGKALGLAAARTSKAIGSFVDVARRTTPVAPVLATKVLSRVAFAPGSDREETPSGPHREQLAPLFKMRANEIRSQVTTDPTGRSVMRPEARADVATRLEPIAAADPLLADRLETMAARRIEFLADKLPRRPDIAGMPIGPDIWKPSDMQMRQWARYVAAVEDPGGIEERLVDGSVTPEDSEVMRTVYPERMAEITREIIEQLPTLRQALPYHRRIALSVFSGVPVDAAMDPRILASLQSSFTMEPGTSGGIEPPKSSPQFGSVKAEKATPSQDRAQGAV